MTAMPSHPESRAPLHRWAARSMWALVACITLFELMWGPVAGMCMANDDLKFVRSPSRELALGDAIVDAWRTQPSFRPLEVAMAHLSDPVTLACPWVAPVQGAGLVALLAGTLALARQALPDLRLLWPLALLLVLLSPATTASVWQMDSCSQTWTAALGAWGAWFAWRWIGADGRGQRPWWAILLLCVIMATGLTIKENFYGWAAGLSAATIGAAMAIGRRDVRAGLRALWVLVPVMAVPLLHLACRWQWSALAGLLSGGGDDTRYRAEFGMNILVNAAVSFAGALGIGPFHLVLDGEAPAALRALPLVATGVIVIVILVALGAAALSSPPSRGIRWPAVAFASSASVISLSATIPMPSVSELYGLGANVGCALIAAAGVAAAWRADDPSRHALIRGSITVSVGCALVVGFYGLFSRAAHFSVVWGTVRTLNGTIVDFQPTLRPQVSGNAGMVHVPTVCLVGATHSQYVMPPLQALDLNLTEAWLARRDPSRRIVFSIGTSPRTPRANERVLDCASLPQHGHW